MEEGLGTVRGPFHIPVMAEAVVAMLAATPAGLIVDGTAGGGGHLLALAEATGPERLVVGVDRDRDALAEVESRLEGRPDLRERVRLFHGDFRDLRTLLQQETLISPRILHILDPHVSFPKSTFWGGPVAHGFRGCPLRKQRDRRCQRCGLRLPSCLGLLADLQWI